MKYAKNDRNIKTAHTIIPKNHVDIKIESFHFNCKMTYYTTQYEYL